MALAPVLEAEWQIAALAVDHGAVRATDAANALLDGWGAPPAEPLEKAGPPEDPGSHGIPEIGREERAFYSALTDGQKDAWDAIQELVLALFRHGKPFEQLDPWKVDEPLQEWKRRAFAALISQPEKAFLLGRVLASEFIEGVKARRILMEQDQRAIVFLQAYAFNEVDTRFDRFKGDLRGALIQGVAEGLNPREVSRLLAGRLDDYRTDLARIAITETARAESAGRLAEYGSAGVERVIGSSAHDPRVCASCLRLIDGHVVAIADTVGKSNYGRKAKDFYAVIPLHPRCRCVWLPYEGVSTGRIEQAAELFLATRTGGRKVSGLAPKEIATIK